MTSTTIEPNPQYHHCYLLQSLSNPSKTYIGYTTNPIRRIKQHNGIIKGGAYQTTKYRPWDMTCVISGFSNDVDGLKFEWAWQNPNKSLIFRSGFDTSTTTSSNSGSTKKSSRRSKSHNQGSSKALVNLLLKNCGKNNYQKQLTILMVLLCQSESYKYSSLSIYFTKDEYRLLFLDLFLGNKMSNNEDFDDDDEDMAGLYNWCHSLPSQMKCNTVSSLEELPFYIEVQENKMRKKKQKKKNHDDNHNQSKRKRQLVGDKEDCDGILKDIQNLSLIYDNCDDDDDDDDSMDTSSNENANSYGYRFHCNDCNQTNERDQVINLLLDSSDEEVDDQSNLKNSISSDDCTIDLTSKHNTLDGMVQNISSSVNRHPTHELGCSVSSDSDIIDLISPCEQKKKTCLNYDSDELSNGTIDLCSP